MRLQLNQICFIKANCEVRRTRVKVNRNRSGNANNIPYLIKKDCYYLNILFLKVCYIL